MNLINSCVSIMHPELNRMKKLDTVNQEHLEGYIRALNLQQLRQTSIKDRVWRIYSFLLFTNFKDLKNVIAEELEGQNYIEKKMIGKEFSVTITDSGSHIACVSGLIE